MKVVLFCGGLGTRLREHSDTIPKPLVPVGERPIIWHLMKYYAHYGHREFILCLGYKGDRIREYFLDYNPYMGRDFVLENGRPALTASPGDVHDWKIRFVDTGLHSNIGERLLAVRDLVAGEDMFLANYSDQLSDLPLDDYIAGFARTDAVAGFVGVRPSQSFHDVSIGDDARVTRIQPVAEADFWINGGYMVMRQEIFAHINAGDELVDAPFQRLIEQKRLYAHRYRGFWAAMDTFKDKIRFDRMCGDGQRPWQVWGDAV